MLVDQIVPGSGGRGKSLTCSEVFGGSISRRVHQPGSGRAVYKLSK